MANKEKLWGLGLELKFRPALKDIQRFMSNLEMADTHWIWKGHKSIYGWGRLRVNNKSIYAHRFAYLIFRGNIKYGEDIHHRCKQRLCCNPYHLKKTPHEEHPIVEQQEEPLPF